MLKNRDLRITLTFALVVPSNMVVQWHCLLTILRSWVSSLALGDNLCEVSVHIILMSVWASNELSSPPPPPPKNMHLRGLAALNCL